MKIDLKTELKEFYTASTKSPQLVTVPELRYLMVDGSGDPNESAEFQRATEALYTLAHTIKYGRKQRGQEPDFSVAPLEGLWWADDIKDFAAGNKKNWKWTLMLNVPEFITKKDLDMAAKSVLEKKGYDLSSLVRLERFKEGPSVQIMHVGPYAAEGPTIERLHAFAKECGAELAGKHHEIYFGDPRRTAPEKLRTLLRQPVKLSKSAASKVASMKSTATKIASKPRAKALDKPAVKPGARRSTQRVTKRSSRTLSN